LEQVFVVLDQEEKSLLNFWTGLGEVSLFIGLLFVKFVLTALVSPGVSKIVLNFLMFV
jgi:hypothetical protein